MSTGTAEGLCRCDPAPRRRGTEGTGTTVPSSLLTTPHSANWRPSVRDGCRSTLAAASWHSMSPPRPAKGAAASGRPVVCVALREGGRAVRVIPQARPPLNSQRQLCQPQATFKLSLSSPGETPSAVLALTLLVLFALTHGTVEHKSPEGASQSNFRMAGPPLPEWGVALGEPHCG